jgi:hypothetical protein
LENVVKTLIGLALGILLSAGAATAACAYGAPTNFAAAVWPADIEVIVVTAKRPVAPAVGAEPIYEVIVTAKRLPPAIAERSAPPVQPIALPKLELAVAEPLIIRL